MPPKAAVFCHDKKTLQTLETVLIKELEAELVTCSAKQEALELILAGRCSPFIVDFDLAGAEEVIRMAALLPPSQKPALVAMASRVWPGTGRAFQSGASRILYKPLAADQVRDALNTGGKSKKGNGRKFARYEMKTLVYLDLERGTIPAISLNIGEHGLAVQAIEPVPMSSNLAFRCVLPGTGFTLHGHADVIWAGDQGRAGLFFSKLSTAARKHLIHWLSKRRAQRDKHRSRMSDLMPPAEADVSFAVSDVV